MTFDRWHGAAAASLVLLAAGAWRAGEAELEGPNILTCRARGAAAAGQPIAMFHEVRVVAAHGGGRVDLWEKGLGPDARARASGITEPVEPGHCVSLRGTFEPPDGVSVGAGGYRVHRTRFVKVWVSLPVLAWVAWMLGRAWRPGPLGLEEAAAAAGEPGGGSARGASMCEQDAEARRQDAGQRVPGTGPRDPGAE